MERLLDDEESYSDASANDVARAIMSNVKRVILNVNAVSKMQSETFDWNT